MADEGAKLIDEGQNGIEAHPEVTRRGVVAPSLPDDKTFNTFRASLAPVACWRLDDHQFAFDSSFVVPEAAAALGALAAMHDDYPDSPMSLFGHADPVGTETYNKELSGRRARAVFALLTRDVDAWETLFNEHGWGLSSTQRILMHLEDRAGAAPPDKFQREADGKDSKEWRDAVTRFQTQNAPPLKVDGVAGKETRKVLYQEYMDAICTDPKGEGFVLTPAAFLGGGADGKRGKGAFQGCSEFNPLHILSKKTSKDLEKPAESTAKKEARTAERNSLNAINRRVVMYFFAPGTTIDVNKWPCPRADEGPADCRKRFWSDHDRRIAPDEEKLRVYDDARDTFACRFYDRLAFRSPCEAGFDEWIVQLALPGQGSPVKHQMLSGVPFVAVAGNHRTTGVTDPNGVLRVRAREKVQQVDLTVSIPPRPPPENEKSSGDGGPASADQAGNSSPPASPTTLKLTLLGRALKELGATAGPANELGAVAQRLRNLGYGPTAIDRWADPQVVSAAVRAFQEDHKASHSLTVSGDENDSATTKALKEIYGS